MGWKRYEDLTGQKFGRWEVLEYSHTNTVYKDKKRVRSEAFWKCKCDCGVVKDVKAGTLKIGDSQSCGCYKNEMSAKRLKGNKMNLSERGHYGITVAFNVYKKGAAKRGLDFLLSREDFIRITSCNCFYCGAKPANVSRHIRTTYSKELTEHSTYIYNGIDRKDNTKGYFLENCLTACKRCNYAKSNMTYDEFLNWNKRLCNHLKLNEEKPYESNLITQHLSEIVTFN